MFVFYRTVILQVNGLTNKTLLPVNPFYLLTCLPVNPSFETLDRVADYHGQHNGGDDGVEPIAVFQKVDERKEHAHDGGEYEYEHTGLYPAHCGERGKTDKDAAQGGVVGMRCGIAVTEVLVVGKVEGFTAVVDQIDNAAHKGYKAGQRHAYAQRVAHKLLHVVLLALGR